MWAVTGGTGLVGRFIVEDLLSRGVPVVVLGRTRPPNILYSKPVAFRPFDLGNEAPDLSGCKVLVHCAFDHIPGKYRGGEGEDPDGFRSRNVDGTLSLFEASRDNGLDCGVFLSSRAVYGVHPPGTTLYETTEPRPDTLYGETKLDVEMALNTLRTPTFQTISIRATGVYGPAGPNQRHKWADMFRSHLEGAISTTRVGTEIHGADLADAIWQCVHQTTTGVVNASDIVLDRRDLLAEVNRLTGCDTPLPPKGDLSSVNAMDCTRLRRLGWVPRGMDGLVSALPAMLAGL